MPALGHNSFFTDINHMIENEKNVHDIIKFQLHMNVYAYIMRSCLISFWQLVKYSKLGFCTQKD